MPQQPIPEGSRPLGPQRIPAGAKPLEAGNGVLGFLGDVFTGAKKRVKSTIDFGGELLGMGDRSEQTLREISERTRALPEGFGSPLDVLSEAAQPLREGVQEFRDADLSLGDVGNIALEAAVGPADAPIGEKIGQGGMLAAELLIPGAIARRVKTAKTAAQAATRPVRGLLPAQAGPTTGRDATIVQEAADRLGGLKRATPTTQRVIGIQPKAAASAGDEAVEIVREAQRMKGSQAAGREIGRSSDDIRAITGVTGQTPLEVDIKFLDRAFSRIMEREGVSLGQRTAISKALKETGKRGGSEAGGLSLRATGTIGGATAGGALGALTGDTVEDRAAGAIAGALLGMVAGNLGARGAEALNRGARITQPGASGARGLGETVLALDSANLLAGPAVIKASMGAAAANVFGAAESLFVTNPAAARRMLRYLFTQAPDDYLNAMIRGRGLQNVSPHIGGTNPVLETVLRPFKSADTISVKAMGIGGFPRDEAVRLLLTGTPTSRQGQKLLAAFQETWAARFLIKFPTVSIQAVERGIEFSPLGFLPKTQSVLRNAKGVEQLTRGQQLFRAGTGTAAAGGGFLFGAANPDMSPRLLDVAASGTGPAVLPVRLSMAAGQKSREGFKEMVMEVLNEAAFSVPQINEGGLRRTFVPREGETLPPRFQTVVTR